MPFWNENLYPPSGFEFVDSDSITHVGSSLSDLISKLIAYRTRRGLPPGNPVIECNEYLCSRFPSRCLNGPPAPEAVIGSPGPSSSSRLVAWLREVWSRLASKTLPYAGEDEVKKRVATCLACPNHIAFPTNCAACLETINQISFQVRAGRDKFSAPLKMCGFFHTDLRVDALLEQPAANGAPANCWKRS